MSTARADPVENLCEKIIFNSEWASFVDESHRTARFVIHFACSPTVNA